MLPTFCPTIWAISLEFCGKPSILEADDFLGACYRKAMTPQKLWTLLSPPSEKLGLQPPFVSPRLDFRNNGASPSTVWRAIDENRYVLIPRHWPPPPPRKLDLFFAPKKFGSVLPYHCHHKHYQPENKIINLSELFPAILDRIATRNIPSELI